MDVQNISITIKQDKFLLSLGVLEMLAPEQASNKGIGFDDI